MPGFSQSSENGGSADLSLRGSAQGASNQLVPSFQFPPDFDMDLYPVGPQDLFQIHLWGRKNESLSIYVDETNSIFVPGVGAISVKNLTLKQLRQRLMKIIRKALPNTDATVVLLRPRSFLVPVGGAVGKQGEVSVQFLSRLSKVIELSGGFSEFASKRRIEIRNGDRLRVVNFQSFLIHGDFKDNPILFDGDRIFVPFRANYVTVRGNVAFEGPYEFGEKDSRDLRSIVESLGGLKQELSGREKISIRRLKGTSLATLYFDLSPNNSEGGIPSDLIVENEDIIFVPFPATHSPGTSDQIFVTGQVVAPGPRKFVPGATANFYISATGGLNSRANLSGIKIYKMSGEVMDLVDLASDALEPGDTIYVPEVTFKFWQDHLAIITTFLGVVTTTVLLSR